MDSIDKYFDRLKNEEKRIDNVVDAKILKEERRAHEMREELDKLDDE